MCEFPTLNSLGDGSQGREHKAVPQCVHREFVETAGDHASVEQAVTFRPEQIHLSSYAVEVQPPFLVAQAQLPAESLFDRRRQDLGQQIGQAIGVFLARNICGTGLPKQLGGIEQEEPEIANGYLADVAGTRFFRVLCRSQGDARHHPLRSSLSCSWAVFGESNQYSSS